MRKLLYAGLAIGVVVILYFLFFGFAVNAFPVSRDSLCGPICPPTGVQYWEKTCRGIVVKERYVTDKSTTHCIGVVLDDKQCYGLLTSSGPVEKVECEASDTSATTELPMVQQNANTGSKTTTPQPSPNTPQPVANRTYTGAGFDVVIPSSWKTVSGVNSYVSLQSPDYVAKSSAEINEREGESKNWVKQGVVIEVFPNGNEVVGTAQTPSGYVAFHASGKYSNLVTQKEISLGGQPAFLLQTRRDDGSLSTSVATVRDGREFQITLAFTDEAGMDWTVWDKFLSGFKFH